MIKNKKLNCLTIFLLIILLLISCSFIEIKQRKTVTATEPFEIISGCFNEYTDSIYLFDKSTGQNDSTRKVDDYRGYFVEKFPSISRIEHEIWDEGYRNGLIEDEWILKIIPKELFQNVGQYFYVGRKYGFFVDNNGENVFVYLMIVKTENFKTVGLIDITINPYFNYTYRYDSITNKAYPIPNDVQLEYKYSNDYFIYYNLDQRDDICLSNISFSSELYNKKHLNQKDNTYNKYNDDGLFFYGTDYTFSGKGNNNDTSEEFNEAVISLALGFIPGGNLLSDVYDYYNISKTIFTEEQKIEASNVKFSDSVNLTLTHNTKNAQLSNGQNELMKNAIAYVKSTADDPILFACNENNYAHTKFFIAGEEEWETRFVGKVSMQICKTGDSAVNGFEILYDDITCTPFYYNIYDNNEPNKSLFNNSTNSCYLLSSDDYNKFDFTPEYSGNYTFTTTGDKNNKLSILDNAGEKISQTLDNNDINKSLSVNLIEGQTYTIQAGLQDKTDYGIYTLKADFTPQELQIGDNSISFNNTNTEYARFKSNKYLNYKFTLSDNAVLELYDYNFNLIDTSQNKILNEELLDEDTYYYLKITYVDNVTKNCNINIIDEKTIIFDCLGGNSLPNLIINNGKEFELPITTKKGYNFIGWSLNQNSENIIQKNHLYNINEPDVKLYANWSIITYTISYEENGGNQIPDGTYTIENYVKLNQNITKAGGYFVGWYKDSGFSNDIITDISIGTTGNKTFYAKWLPETIVFSLNINAIETDNERAFIAKNTFNVHYNQSYQLPIPILDGFKFMGWYNGSTHYTYEDGNSINDCKNENSIELLAHWSREKYIFEINYEDKTVEWLTKDGLKQTVENGDDIIYKYGFSPVQFMSTIDHYREGAIYNGLYYDEKYTQSADWIEYGLNGAKSGTIVLYAKYNPEHHKISFYNYSQSQIKIIEKDYGTYITLPNLNSEDYKELWIKGKSFIKWIVKDCEENKNYTGNFAIGSTIPFNLKMPDLSENNEYDGNIIYLKAVFDYKKYNISLKDEATGYNNNLTVTYNMEYGSCFPKKDITDNPGYDFMGWYSDTYGQVINSYGKLVKGEYVSTNNTYKWNIDKEGLELTAKWIIHNYSIIYVLNDGTQNSENPNSYNVETPTIILKNATRTGYRFLGWFKENIPLNASSVIPSGSTGDKTFYARWAFIYTINFNTNGGTTCWSMQGICTENKMLPLSIRDFCTGYWQVKGCYNYNFNDNYYINIGHAINGVITFEAKWTYCDEIYTISYIRGKIYRITDDGNFNNPCDTINLNSFYGLDFNELKANGFKTISLNLSLNLRKINNGYQWIVLYNSNGDVLDYIQTNKNYDWNTYKFTFNIDLNSLTNNSFIVRYGASGSGNDDWENVNLYISLSLKK
jgi:uncharacterized repeat protein (TIGR02543 family)